MTKELWSILIGFVFLFVIIWEVGKKIISIQNAKDSKLHDIQKRMKIARDVIMTIRQKQGYWAHRNGTFGLTYGSYGLLEWVETGRIKLMTPEIRRVLEAHLEELKKPKFARRL